MIIVDHFQEGFYSSAFGYSRFAHLGGNLARITLNSDHYSVTIFTILGALVKVFNDDGFFASISALGKDGHLYKLLLDTLHQLLAFPGFMNFYTTKDAIVRRSG